MCRSTGCWSRPTRHILAPIPYRGKRNEPAYVAATAVAVAALKGITPDELAAATTENFFSLFGKAARPRGMKVTVLGCGPSWGVPAIGPDWGECDPTEPRNRRTRASLLIENRGSVLLIDMAPDLRQQLLKAGTTRIDAVLLTHAHADHLHGIDDLRRFNQLTGQAIPLYGMPDTLAEVQDRFGYALRPPMPGRPLYRPALAPVPITGPFTAAGLAVVPFAQSHGYSTTLGFRIGPVGYSTDCHRPR